MHFPTTRVFANRRQPSKLLDHKSFQSPLQPLLLLNQSQHYISKKILLILSLKQTSTLQITRQQWVHSLKQVSHMHSFHTDSFLVSSLIHILTLTLGSLLFLKRGSPEWA